MNNQEFTQAFEELTGEKIDRIEWVYGVDGENIADGGGEIYQVHITLQLILESGGYVYASFFGHCSNPLSVIESSFHGIDFYSGEDQDGEYTWAESDTMELLENYAGEWWDESIKSSEKELSYFESV